MSGTNYPAESSLTSSEHSDSSVSSGDRSPTARASRCSTGNVDTPVYDGCIALVTVVGDTLARCAHCCAVRPWRTITSFIQHTTISCSGFIFPRHVLFVHLQYCKFAVTPNPMKPGSTMLESTLLNKHRTDAGLTIPELAVMANVDATTILRIEQGKDPRLSTWRKIVTALEFK